MYLPPRIAASLTVTIVTIGALLIAGALSTQSKMPAWITAYQMGGAMLMAGTFALPVVIPNIAAALIANRAFGTGSPLLYAGLFIAIFLVLWVVEMNFILRFIGALTLNLADLGWKTGAYISTNVAVCLVAAWWYGSRGS